MANLRLGKLLNARRWLRKAGVLRLDLHFILQQADPKASLGTRSQWLEELIAWVRIATHPQQEAGLNPQIQSARVKFLFMILDRNPELKEKVSATISSIILDSEALHLFSQLGLSREHGFFAEAFDRISRKFIPTPYNERDLSELFIRIFKDEQDADWVANLDEAAIGRLQKLMFYSPETQNAIATKFITSIRGALIVLSSQVSALGMSAEIRSRAEIRDVEASAFFQLTKRIADLHGSADANVIAYLGTLQVCREEIKAALSHLDAYGVSVAIVYRLEFLEQAIDRCERLATMLLADESQSGNWKLILADLIRSQFKSVELTSLIKDNLDLLARKIVERTGVSGEHYIARSKSEYFEMLISAAGGGFLTAFTTMFKFWITYAKLPMFVEGFFALVNYAGSFLLMQGFHFTLATKQPSMTAPALALKLKGLKRRTQILEFVDEVATVARSQFAAAVGNIGMVVPTSILIHVIWSYFFDGPIISGSNAQKVIQSLNPLTTLTVPMAALTGVILWLSSVAAGWLENWIVFRRLPEALAQNQTIKNLFGSKANQKASDWLVRNASGVAGNVTLGFLLAFTPIVGQFLGLPIYAPHVTLSSGAFAFAISELGLRAVTPVDLFMAVTGIVSIGLLNFGVSFSLALYTAVRARRVRRVWLVHLAAMLWAKFRFQPFDFFVPRRTE